MDQWLPVIATLSGAVVAGTVAILVHWLSNKQASKNLKMQLVEERAKWAIDKQLDRMQRFYVHLEGLLSATDQFRVSQAWKATEEEEDETRPAWVPKDNDAREAFEKAMSLMSSELVFMDEPIQDRYGQAKAGYMKWYTSKSTRAGAEELMKMYDDLNAFRRWIGETYRKTFHDRRLGLDQ